MQRYGGFMIYDSLGLPKPTGASDYLDSACVAGLCTLFEYGPEIDLTKYLKNVNGKTIYVRHPEAQIPPDFSRDQYIALIAGLWKQEREKLVRREFVSGKDILSPGNIGHESRCKDLIPWWYENLWLKGEILYHAKFTPLAESNQLIAMMIVAGPEYLRLWTKNNPQWERSILKYWCEEDGAWRQESDFAAHMIKFIKDKINA